LFFGDEEKDLLRRALENWGIRCALDAYKDLFWTNLFYKKVVSGVGLEVVSSLEFLHESEHQELIPRCFSFRRENREEVHRSLRAGAEAWREGCKRSVPTPGDHDDGVRSGSLLGYPFAANVTDHWKLKSVEISFGVINDWVKKTYPLREAFSAFKTFTMAIPLTVPSSSNDSSNQSSDQSSAHSANHSDPNQVFAHLTPEQMAEKWAETKKIVVGTKVVLDMVLGVGSDGSQGNSGSRQTDPAVRLACKNLRDAKPMWFLWLDLGSAHQ
jgi:hypothetical protein